METAVMLDQYHYGDSRLTFQSSIRRPGRRKQKARDIERDYLAIDQRFVRQLFHAATIEATTLAKSFPARDRTLNSAVCFEADRTITIELEFVGPDRAFGKFYKPPRRASAQQMRPEQ
jgi:hypothetical protein